MTLILTYISSLGIIHASDGNLTAADGSCAGEAAKVFPIRFLKAGLTIAGSYGVGGHSMGQWIDSFVRGQEQAGCRSLNAFSSALAGTLETQMTQPQKAEGSMVQVAGYVQDSVGWHPEFWFIRNVYRMDPKTGEYSDIRDTFQISEDFWARDWTQKNLAPFFQQGGHQVYINGFTSGRISYIILESDMASFFEHVWSNRAWKFRRPASLQEIALIVDLYIRTIGVLFSMSDYSAPFIGGTPQVYAIPRPQP